MRTQDIVRATTAYHDELNPRAWNGTELKPEVRERLIGIAQLFIGYLEVDNFVVEDIVLTGSLANYNYTKFSDFDLHVITDYKNLQCDDLAEAFYRAKKTIWNERHDIKIYGHEVELYVEDVNEPPVSGGVFSILHDQWIKKPSHKAPNINDTAIVRKVQELADQIKRSMATADDPEDLKRLTDKLRTMRQAGLDAGGEFSVENLAFKTLRNMGIIKALHDAYINKQDHTMSLNEAHEGAMREIIRKALPGWPDYVIKDWINSRIKNEKDLKDLQGWMGELNKMVEPNSWKLHQKMFLTFDMLSPKTRYFMKIKRNFGEKNPFFIPRDEERSEQAEQLVRTQGMENLPPVIMLQHSNGLELCEGWHRTMAAFRVNPEGFYINAWVARATS